MPNEYMMPPSDGADDDGIPDSSNAIPHDEPYGDTFSSDFGVPQQDSGSLFSGPDVEAEREQESLITPDNDDIDPTIIEPKKRKPKAKTYENKTRGLMRTAFTITAGNEKTVADAATILRYGPKVSHALGDLAAENEWVASAVDMLTEGTENAAVSLALVGIPMLLQIARNHEPVADISPYREIKVPFTKRTVKVRFRFKLRRFRHMTQPPEQLVQTVFGNDQVRATLVKQGFSFGE